MKHLINLAEGMIDMNTWLKKYRLDILVGVGLVGLYLITRLINLTLVPVFTDEAIYIRWSQIGLQDAAWRYIPLTDGKPPLYHWFLMAVMSTDIFADPLVEGRIVSVAAGLINSILVGGLGFVLFNRRQVGYVASLLYILSPFMLVYDRLAIVDSLLTTTCLASLFFAVLLVKYKRLDTALLFGASVGAGMLTKASGLIFLLLAPATILVGEWHRSKWLSQGLLWGSFLVVAAIISQAIYSILRLSEFFYRIEQKNYEFIVPLSEFLAQPFSMTWGNLKSLMTWQLEYLTWTIVLVVLYNLTRTKYWRQNLLLMLYVFAPMFMIASFNKIIFARFLLFSTPFIFIIAARGLTDLMDRLRWPISKLILLVAICAPAAIVSYQWIFTPAIAAIPQADRDQYFDSWPAGHGIAETVSYFETIAEQEPIFIGTQGTFGLMPYALEMYLADNPNVEISSYWPVEKVPDEVSAKAEEKMTFFIYNELEQIPPQDNLELVLEFEKRRLDEVRHMRVYRVLEMNHEL